MAMIQHDTIFTNQTGENVGGFSDRRLEAFAEQIRLYVDDWAACFD